MKHNNKCLTIYSAPHYSQFKNLGAYLQIDYAKMIVYVIFLCVDIEGKERGTEEGDGRR